MWFGLIAWGGLLMVYLFDVGGEALWFGCFWWLVLLVVDDCYAVFGRGFVFWDVDTLR